MEPDRPAGVLLVLLAHELAQLEAHARLRCPASRRTARPSAATGSRLARAATSQRSMVERPKRTGSPVVGWRHDFSASRAISAWSSPRARRRSEQRSHDRKAQPCPPDLANRSLSSSSHRLGPSSSRGRLEPMPPRSCWSGPYDEPFISRADRIFCGSFTARPKPSRLPRQLVVSGERKPAPRAPASPPMPPKRSSSEHGSAISSTGGMNRPRAPRQNAVLARTPRATTVATAAACAARSPDAHSAPPPAAARARAPSPRPARRPRPR